MIPENNEKNELEEALDKSNINLKNEKDGGNKQIILEKEKNISNQFKIENEIINNINEKIDDLNINQQNKSTNNQNQTDYTKKMIELENEIFDLKKKLKRYPYILEENEKLISIIFSSIDEKMNYPMICKNTSKIHDLEKELYKEYPDFSYSENDFLFKGKIIDKNQSFQSIGIKNGDIIILKQKND